MKRTVSISIIVLALCAAYQWPAFAADQGVGVSNTLDRETLLMAGDPVLLVTEQGRRWYNQIKGGQGAEAALDIIRSFGQGNLPDGFPLPGTKA